MSTTEHDYDLVVLGTGIAGQVAATTAAEAGLSVALLEKTNTRGGSSVMSGGWFAFSGTEEQAAEDEQDSRELFRRDLLEVGEHLNHTALVDAYLDRQHETYQWLKSHGVEFRKISISSGQSAKRSHLSEIKDVIAALHKDFEAAGGTTFMEHRGHLLNTEQNGRVTGVVATSPQGEVRFNARGGVVLATGGFSRGTEMLRIFAPSQLNAIPFGGRGNTGDGLRMAWKLGAGMADMSFVSGTYGSHPETGDEFHELLTAYYMGAIIVNQDGRRFTDESQSYKTLGRDVLEQPEGLGFEIFDATVRAMSERGVPLKDIDTLEDMGHVFRADTLEELARISGINAGALVKTVADYNQAIAAGEPDELGRTSLCNGVGKLLPIAKAPFFAYPAKSLMTTTYCGLSITAEGQVTDVDGGTIEGVYAVGEVTGGFHGAAYMTGSSLGKGAIFGHSVANRVAKELAS
ncbi:MAG: FAD-dependent oxidoreductase [Paeniglutamicibacter sp.]